MPPPTEEPAPIAGEGYEIVFEDDFLGTSLNEDIWVPPPHHGTSFPAGVISVANSILTVDVPFDQTPRNYVELWSLGPQSPIGNGYPRYPDALAWQECYVEVRCRITNDPWTKHTVWMFSLEQENAFGLTRDCSELNCEWDIFENGNRAGFAGPTAYADVNHVHVRHRNTSGPGVCGVPDQSDHQNVNGTGFNDWHVWGGKWIPTKIQSYLDGTLMTTSTPHDSFAQPMALILTAAPLNYSQAQIDQWSIPAPPAEIVADYDWVRVWQRPRKARRCVLSVPGTASNYASTPDHPSLDITGDLDIRLEVALADWTPATAQSLISKYTTSGNQRSYRVRVQGGSTGLLELTWTANGLSAVVGASSEAPTVDAWDTLGIWVTLDADDGSGNRIVTWRTGPSINGPWTQLGTNTPVAGTATIFAGTGILEIGSVAVGATEVLNGQVVAAEVRNGIDGPVVAHFDARNKVPGETSWSDETGKIWTVNGTAKIIQGTPKPDLYQTVSPLRLT